MKSWLSPKTKKGLKSKIHGRGFFAIKNIKKGEVVAIKGGHLITGKQLKKLKIKDHCELQIDNDLYVGPLTEKEFEDSMILVNHSCDPNAGIKDKVKVVAIRNIKNGEEIVIDYGMIDDNNNHIMKCNCQSPNCRKKITGKDWKNPKLQKKYKGFFSPFIQKKIDKSQGH
jgi:SET domain-containing protein